ncbi:MAG: UDP-N-acetylmuramate--L-alanine ligase [Clostridia bacterium]|nr:UDP-N-acetylmuramate--L-alanine ligase [Clostridia bacterium]
MKKIKNLKYTKNIHFVGIGGVSMSGIAKYLKLNGKIVTGSDRVYSESLKQLEKLKIKVHVGEREESINDANLVVVTSAISNDNLEVLSAKKQKIKVVKRSVLLGEILSDFEVSIGVAGCHGKTTTTAMITKIFALANKKPTSFIGGYTKEFSNFLYGEKKFVITEACEFKKNFLDLKPTVSVILNVDNDHLDFYKSLSNIKKAFKKFAKGSKVVVNADDINCKKIKGKKTLTFGIENNANYMATNLYKLKNGYSFTLVKNKLKIGRIKLNVLGKYNVYNALASIVVADMYNIPFVVIQKALSTFYGVERRLEEKGEYKGTKIICDYAHHPTEISSVLSAINVSKNDLVVFQPHTYSRTKLLMQEFIKSLSVVENLVLVKTYSAREKEDFLGSSYTLYKNLLKKVKNLVYADNFSKLKEIIKSNAKNYERIIFLGAGDVYNFVEKIL